jgi:hypothetical protein
LLAGNRVDPALVVLRCIVAQTQLLQLSRKCLHVCVREGESSASLALWRVVSKIDDDVVNVCLRRESKRRKSPTCGVCEGAAYIHEPCTASPTRCRYHLFLHESTISHSLYSLQVLDISNVSTPRYAKPRLTSFIWTIVQSPHVLHAVHCLHLVRKWIIIRWHTL